MGQPSPASHPPDAAAHGRVTVNGIALAADCLGALYWREEGLLVVADLHLEKGSSFARRGQLLPPYDTTETLARLARLIAHYAPRTVIALGDNFHDGGGPARLSAAGSRLARRAPARARLDLDRRQPRSRSGGRHRRHVRRDALDRRAHLPPHAFARCAGGRDRRPSPPGRAGRAARPRGVAAAALPPTARRW